MSDEHIKTVVLNDKPKPSPNSGGSSASKDKSTAVKGDNEQTSSDPDFTQTYSYLT